MQEEEREENALGICKLAVYYLKYNPSAFQRLNAILHFKSNSAFSRVFPSLYILPMGHANML